MRNLSFVSICSIILVQSTIADFSFKQLYHRVIPPKLHLENAYEKINPKIASLLTIKNECGNVITSTDNTEPLVLLKITKKSPHPDRLKELSYKHSINGQELIIESMSKELKEYESIDFDIVVPQKLAQSVSVTNGNIHAKDTMTPTRLSSTKGSIEISNTNNSVDAITQQKGNITVRNSHARTKAQTNTGNINIYDSYHSVVATTQHGSILLYAQEVPSTCTISLNSVYGTITAHLPPDVNADIQAFTKFGTITSDHMITLKPQTTQLNRQAWKRLQKEIEGTLGSGEAQIKLSSMKSDIKLVEIKA